MSAQAVVSMGCDPGLSVCGRARHGYLFVIQQLTEVRPGCQDPGMVIFQIVLTGYMQPGGVTLRVQSCPAGYFGELYHYGCLAIIYCVNSDLALFRLPSWGLGTCRSRLSGTSAPVSGKRGVP
jgi:hypothetical protein